jgi:hypothetical protein
MDPARNRDNRAALLAALWSPISPMDGEGALKGLGDGDGREVLATSVGRGAKPLLAPPGEKRDGTVPARARLVEGWFSGVGRCEKSGKPSVGDSGMFSRRGVELPLVGGPQTLTGRPSWACISRALQRRLGCAAALGGGGLVIPLGEQSAGAAQLVRWRSSPRSRAAGHLARRVQAT